LSAISPFFAAHLRPADAPRFFCAPGELSNRTEAAPFADNEETRSLLVKDRTPGLYLCEETTPEGTRRLLAARLEQGEGRFSFCLPEVLCTYIVPQTGKNAVFVPEILDRLSACTKPAAAFEAGGVLYTAKPIHDPVACRTLTESMAGCALQPLEGDVLPPEGTLVLIRFEPTADRFAAGLLFDLP